MAVLNDYLQKLGEYMKKSMIYVMIFIFFTFNFIALSISIQCNRNSGLGLKIASGMFAFLFGILYIGFNYLQYKVKIKKDPCTICGDDPFG